ncbi:MAG: hypothetical protein U0457_10455 [Candidatus Sericytochromatia bacterium]
MVDNLKYKIAVFGLGSDNLTEQNKIDAFELGKQIAKSKNILVTGLAKGVTEYALKGNKSEGGISIGINPYDNNEKTYEDLYINDNDIIINTGFQDRGRNIISVRTCDGMIVINGNFGVLNEITNGVGENKPIVVLKNSGGVTEIIELIFKTLKPDYKYFKMCETITECYSSLIELIKIIKMK